MLTLTLIVLASLLLPLVILSIHTVLTHWADTEGMFTMIYLCMILSILAGWTMTDILDINIFLR